MDGHALVGVLLGLVVLLVVMLVGREIVTWYWKVNEAITRLEMIEGVLRNIDKNLIIIAAMAHPPAPVAASVNQPHAEQQKWGVGS